MLMRRKKAERQGAATPPPFRVSVQYPRRRQMPPTLRAAEPDENIPGSGWRRVVLLVALVAVVTIVLVSELSRFLP